MNYLQITAFLSFALVVSISAVSAKESDGDSAEAFAQFVPEPNNDAQGVSGFFGFHSVKENDECRFSGSFESGLSSSNPENYELKIESAEGTPVFNLSKVFQRIQITSNGSEYFQENFPKSELNCAQIDGKSLVLYLRGQRIGSAVIQTLS